MANWLTTHYPHPKPDTHPWHLYLQKKHKDAVTGIQVGDRIFFYEFAEQKPIKGAPKYPRGAQGIVRVAYVSGPLYRRETVIEHADGTTAYWWWGVPTIREDTGGFVSRAELNGILGYKPNYNLKGFQRGTGVKRLSDEEAATLWQLFKAGRLP